MVNLKIGLVGGSFNPAHQGHKYISEQAIKLLGLDEIWWIVTPHNPLKDKAELAAIETRIQTAETVKDNPQIKVKLLESEGKTNYSIDLIKKLLADYNHNFCWLMGADNAKNFHHWHQWQKIIELIRIAIFPRNDVVVLKTEFAATYKNQQTNSNNIFVSSPPSWCLLDIPQMDISASKLRNSS